MENPNEKENLENAEEIELFDENDKVKFDKTFSKSDVNKVLFGVCGGIADYLNIQPAIVRIIFSLSIFIGGWGLIFYLIAAFTMPSDTNSRSVSEEEKMNNLNREIKIIVTVLVICIGIYEILNAYSFWMIVSIFGFSPKYYIPVLILAAGMSITLKSFKMPNVFLESKERKFFRSVKDKSILGVAGGLAKYFNVSSVFMRTVLMILFFLTGGIITIPYLVMGFTVPGEGQLDL